MKKYAVVLAVVLFIFAFVVGVFANDIIWDDIGRGSLNLRAVLVNPDNPQVIYVGSSNAVLKSEDAGVSWRNILLVRGSNRGVNFLALALGNQDSLYAATANGLYHSSNQGKNWNRIFKGKSYFESECTTIAVLTSTLYLGTKAGLFVSKDKGRTWHRQSGEIGKTSILAIAYNLNEPNSIYVACADGVFKSKDSGQSWERSFIAYSTKEENDNDAEDEAEGQDEEVSSSNIRYLAIDPNNSNYLYLATSRGVYQSQDRGLSWELFSSFGLLNQDVRFLLISAESHLYAVTKSGIFEYGDNRWKELSLGLAATEINHLALDKRHNLYAATEKGLFRGEVKSATFASADDSIPIYSKDEPKINEVQQAAIKYAEVEPDKIKEWRKKAKLKAILPKFTVGLDRSENTNYEIYTSATTKYVYEGPDDKSNGWDVTLSWELGDLIWNEAQTSIDVRSKLMVQLREDVLDEVTKLYFERIRVKMELDNLSIEDRKKRFERELKLQELTAQLDGLTGGYFSSQIK